MDSGSVQGFEKRFDARSNTVTAGVAMSLVVCLMVAFWPQEEAKPEDSDVVSVVYSNDGEWIVGATRRGVMLRWRAADGEPDVASEDTSPTTNETAVFNGFALSSNGEYAVRAGSGLDFLAFGAQTTIPAVATRAEAYGGVALSHDNRELAALSSDEKLMLWRLGLSEEPRELGPADAGVYGAASFSPDGRRILVAGHSLRMVEVDSGKDVWQKPRANYVFIATGFSPDGSVVATGSQDATVRLWEASGGELLGVLRGHRGYVDAVAFSPDGELLASWSRDGKLLLWSLGQAGRPHKLLGNSTGGAAFSSNGRWVVSGGPNQTVLIWNARDGKFSKALHWDSEQPDGKTEEPVDEARMWN